MKTIKYISMLAVLAGSTAFAGPIKVQSATDLPASCRHIGDVKVGDIAAGKSHSEVAEGLEKAAQELGGNYVQTDIKRVNHPKMGVYYWGWGTVGICQ